MSLGRPGIPFRALTFSMLACVSTHAQDAVDAGPAVALDPIDGIVDAFGSHRVVAMTEGVGHGHEQGHAFLRTLIRDARLAGVVDDIVVEWGNSLYQDVIDRFTRGEDVPYSELRKVWENTTQRNPVWDGPVFRAFFETVRARNETLPEAERIRVLLGDPPVDWQAVDSPRDLAQVSRQRDAYPAELIRDEVIEKGRRALVVYGGLHLLRLPRQQDSRGDSAIREPEWLGVRLEREGTDVFNIWGVPADVAADVQPDVAAWSPIRMTLIENTPLGAASFRSYFPAGDATPMQEQFDALMIFGPRSATTFSRLSPELCMDDAYIEMRLRRMGYDDRQAFVRRYCERTSADD